MAEAQGLYSQDKDPKTGLTANQRTVLEGFERGDTQMKIAEDLGVSRQRVNQITRDLKSKGYELKRKATV